ncbi:MAG: hypothetical protein ILP13_02385 [Lachnospiraceae bacterium]|nr:hypothetical protein [Lachnospiraceae bacterium]
MISLSGNWKIEYTSGGVKKEGSIFLPGIMQAAGYGDPITAETDFVSSLHDPDWSLWEEFKCEDGEVNVPFLSKPRRHFVGVCSYQRTVDITREQSFDELFFFAELVRRKSSVYVDDVYKGSCESYCAPHIISLGRLSEGLHTVRVEVDNRLFPGFRPDAHTVTDGVGAAWNGLVGEVKLLSLKELQARYTSFKQYAKAHPRSISTDKGNFVIDGKPEYIRGTHFGGDYPKTGYPETDKDYYVTIFERLKDWGFNTVRCHSFCPPEAMFTAADECGIYILAECGMWSTFSEDSPVTDLLKLETEAILREFGHHPSFVMLSPSNEPGGNWYKVLRDWVSFARKTDEKLGYAGRRLYTAQSGWFYDTAPAETEGTDFLYFHRSAFGPLKGGTVRNPAGWQGKNYSASLEGVKLPVICHELGQWCAYPDLKVADKLTGFLKPSNYRAFENLAKKNDLTAFTDEMHISSGKNQLRLLKEEFEANYRTPELKGYEYLDVHDYPGQGTAFVGIFDALFEPKAYADRDYFRQFNSEDVLTAAFESYSVDQGSTVEVPVALSHYSDALGTQFRVRAELLAGDTVIFAEEHTFDTPERGSKVNLGNFTLRIPGFEGARLLIYKLTLDEGYSNSWELFAIPAAHALTETLNAGFVLCRSFNEVFDLLDEGKDVLFLPRLSELDYDCAPVNERSVFWNAQMGPKWERSLGLRVDTEKGVFKYFPSSESGGFQWASVLRSGRGIKIPGTFKPIVRVIDDWNRSVPTAFLLEAKVSKGRLLMSAFDESLYDTPECRLYYDALCRYISSEDFAPAEELPAEALKSIYFPVDRMKTLVSSVTCREGSLMGEPEAMVLSNPNKVALAKGNAVTFEIKLKEPVKIEGFVWLNDQRNRFRDDFAKDIRIFFVDTAVEDPVYTDFRIKNTIREQRLLLKEPVTTDLITLKILDTWGREEKLMYVETPTGFERQRVRKDHKVGIAAFHIITDLTVSGESSRFWDKDDEVLTKEIDL